jgi:23S rRNA (uracil1939-C5)-methyltransferase
MTRGKHVELELTALAAGGDALGRDTAGRVTFVPRAAPGDRVRARIVKETASFARAELEQIVTASPSRVEPPCEFFRAGCGGCQWQHVTRTAQVEAKQAIVAGALRGLAGLAIEPIADPAPSYGWRRRARFHVVGGRVGLYAAGSHRVVELARCPQLEPTLEAALRTVASSSPPDGELALLRGHTGAVAVGVAREWRGAAPLVGRAGIVGVKAGDDTHGDPVIEVEPGLWAGPWDFAQASAAGNAALIAATRVALGPGRGRMLELHAGVGNFTRAFVADGWQVIASDVAPPPRAIDIAFELGSSDEVLARVAGPFEAIVLDPPRTGAKEAIAGILRHAPRTIVYVSCDPATLARDAAALVDDGYRADRAWPIDLMPQTSHVEVVMSLARVR